MGSLLRPEQMSFVDPEFSNSTEPCPECGRWPVVVAKRDSFWVGCRVRNHPSGMAYCSGWSVEGKTRQEALDAWNAQAILSR